MSRENQYTAVKKRTLGFQKVRTRDLRSKVKTWLGEWYPAEVEGSDCKSISQIGAGEKTYIKIGAYTYDAVRFALLDEQNRTSREPDRYLHSRITAARFTGGTLDGEELHFSPELKLPERL